MKLRTTAAAGAIFALLLTGCSTTAPPASTTEPESPDETMSASLFITSPSLGFIAPLTASSFDLDAENGLDLEVATSGASSAILVAGVKSGEYDFMIGGATAVVDASAQGGEMVIVCGTNTAAVTLIMRDDIMATSGITAESSLKDRVEALRGKKIVTSAPGSINYDMLRRVLDFYGIDADRDVTILPAQDGAALVAGLIQGHFDASFYSSGVAEAAVAQGVATVIGSVGRGDFVDALGNIVGTVAAATAETVRDNPELVDRFIATMQSAQELVATDASRVKDALQEDWFSHLDPSIWDASWEYGVVAVPPSCTFTEDDYATVVSLLSDPSVADDLAYEDVVYAGIR